MAPVDATRVTERETILAGLAGFPARLRSAAVAAEVRPVPAGEWGPHEVVRHLIACEIDVHQARLADLATVAAPTWGRAEPAPWPGEPEFSLTALLDRFAELRAETLATVVALDDAGWARTGTHETLGVVGAQAVLGNAVSHDEEHLRGLG
ncbi:hypothetical protein BH20CHL7_BH20CHL7_17750 [soil metagenome]